MAAPTIPLSPQQKLWPFFPQNRLYAIQHVRKMRGGSQAQMMRASDNRYYIVKLQGNPQHDRVLANDFFASRLGQLLALPMPAVRVIELSEEFIQSSPELCIESGGLRRPPAGGLHFASQAVADPHCTSTFDYLPSSGFLRVLNRLDFAKVLVLDKWTSNADGRQAVFTQLFGNAGYSVHFIDQGYSFNAGDWTFPDAPLRGVYCRNEVYEHVTSWEDFEPALSIAEEMDIDEIWSCASDIPSAWCGDDAKELARLVETLYERRSKIRNLISAFRESSRSPFPNWTSH